MKLLLFFKLELEKMQKIQYKQEKKLLRQKANEKGNDSDNQDTSLKELNELVSEEESEHFDQNENDKTANKEDNSTLVSGKDSVTNRQGNIDSNSSRVASLNTNRSVQSSRLDSFTKNMEERAKQREQLRKEREEIRKRKEMEKLELLKGKLRS